MVGFEFGNFEAYKCKMKIIKKFAIFTMRAVVRLSCSVYYLILQFMFTLKNVSCTFTSTCKYAESLTNKY